MKFNHRGIDIWECSCCVLLYADDIAPIADNEEKMQAMLNRVDPWSIEWRLLVNPQKFQILHFRPQSHTMISFVFKFGQVELSLVHQYKYLRAILDELCNVDIVVRTLAAAGR